MNETVFKKFEVQHSTEWPNSSLFLSTQVEYRWKSFRQQVKEQPRASKVQLQLISTKQSYWGPNTNPMCLIETFSIVLEQSIKRKKTASKLEVWKTARWLNEYFFLHKAKFGPVTTVQTFSYRRRFRKALCQTESVIKKIRITTWEIDPGPKPCLLYLIWR